MADRAPPVAARWTGEHFEPLPAWRGICRRHYVHDTVYAMEAHEARSARSHRHYFAAIKEAWQNLDDLSVARWPNPEALRHFALIKAGYCDTETFVASSKTEATRWAAFVRPRSEGAIVVVRENVVTAYTPHSQSEQAMGKEAFQESKDAVLGVLADLIGVDASALSRAAA